MIFHLNSCNNKPTFWPIFDYVSSELIMLDCNMLPWLNDKSGMDDNVVSFYFILKLQRNSKKLWERCWSLKPQVPCPILASGFSLRRTHLPWTPWCGCGAAPTKNPLITWSLLILLWSVLGIQKTKLVCRMQPVGISSCCWQLLLLKIYTSFFRLKLKTWEVPEGIEEVKLRKVIGRSNIYDSWAVHSFPYEFAVN